MHGFDTYTKWLRWGATTLVSIGTAVVGAPLASAATTPPATVHPSGPPAVPSHKEVRIVVTAHDHRYDPALITVRPNQRVIIDFRNAGKDQHNLTFETLSYRTPTIAPGQSAQVSLVTPQPGRYGFYCSVDRHKELGMIGWLMVVSPAVR